MDKRKKILLAVVVVLIGVCVIIPLNSKNKKDNIPNNPEPQISQEEQKQEKTVIKPQEKSQNQNKNINQTKINGNIEVSQEKESVIKTNLYNDLPPSAIPFSAITELPTMPNVVKNSVKNIINSSNNIYMLKKHGDKVVLVVENPANIRHNIEFIEISAQNGHLVKTTLGYNDKMKDSDNDKWEYEKNSNNQIPVRHTKYNNEGDVEFVEVWNYDDSDPVKYEMTDSEGKVISIRKETLDNGTDLRVEHILYDKNGKTHINVSATYEGADIKRFTYYNADKPQESGSVFGEYKDGVKVKETLYTSDLKVKNTYNAEYNDGVRTQITIFDSNNNETGLVTAQ